MSLDDRIVKPFYSFERFCLLVYRLTWQNYSKGDFRRNEKLETPALNWDLIYKNYWKHKPGIYPRP